MQSLYEPVTVNAEHMAAAKAESLMRDHREGGHMRRCEVRRPAGYWEQEENSGSRVIGLSYRFCHGCKSMVLFVMFRKLILSTG